MATLTKEQENFIEHEVQLRLHDEKFTLYQVNFQNRFEHLEKRMDKLDNKLNWILGIVVGSVLLPAALHYLHLM